MRAQPPATTNLEIVAAVATLTAQVIVLNAAMLDLKNDMRADLATINATVGSHTSQIADWKRDGKWLGSALVGLGALAAFFVSMARDWFFYWLPK